MTTSTLLTLEQFRQRPEDGRRYELVNGEPREMTFPRPRHNRPAGEMFALFREYAHEHGGEAFLTDTGYILSRDPDSLRGPDASYLLPESLVRVHEDEDIEGAPDVAVEVMSPSDTAEELREKVQQYLRAGCRAVIVLYPRTRQAEVFRPDGTWQSFGPGDQLTLPDVMPGFAVWVKSLFGAPGRRVT